MAWLAAVAGLVLNQMNNSSGKADAALAQGRDDLAKKGAMAGTGQGSTVADAQLAQMPQQGGTFRSLYGDQTPLQDATIADQQKQQADLNKNASINDQPLSNLPGGAGGNLQVPAATDASSATSSSGSGNTVQWAQLASQLGQSLMNRNNIQGGGIPQANPAAAAYRPTADQSLQELIAAQQRRKPYF